MKGKLSFYVYLEKELITFIERGRSLSKIAICVDHKSTIICHQLDLILQNILLINQDISPEHRWVIAIMKMTLNIHHNNKNITNNHHQQ